MSDPVLIREFNPAVKGELEFIMATWLRELHDADPSGLPSDLWYEAHRKHVDRTLADRNCVCLMAVAADDPEQILGYVVAFPGRNLEWVHVKKRYRGEGLAKRLLLQARVVPGLPARFATPSSKQKIRCPLRSRQLRSPRSSTASE